MLARKSHAGALLHRPRLVDKFILMTDHLREDTEFFQTSTREPILYKPFGLDELLNAVGKTPR